MADEVRVDEIEVEVAWPDGSRVQVRVCRLPAGARVRDALLAAAAPRRAAIGIFGLEVGEEELLHGGDRIEIYDALPNDPKRARRERVRRSRQPNANRYW